MKTQHGREKADDKNLNAGPLSYKRQQLSPDGVFVTMTKQHTVNESLNLILRSC